MARFLFCPVPEAGDVFPSVPIALELRSRGHEIAYITGSAMKQDLAHEGITCHDTRNGVYGYAGGKDSASVSLAEMRAQVEGLDTVFAQFPADVIVDGSFPFGPRIFSELQGVTRASLQAGCFPIPTCEPLYPYGGGHLPPTDKRGKLLARLAVMAQSDRDRERTAEWDATREWFGLPACGVHPARTIASPDLVMLASTPAFEYPRADFPRHYWFTGPLTWQSRRFDTPERIASLSTERPIVFVSQGTTYNNDPVILKLAFEALRDEPVQVVATTSRPFDLAEFGPLPGNVILERFIPFPAFVDRISLAITHGGAGAVHTALSRGIPVIALPLAADQFEVAARCVWTGAGQRLDALYATPEQLRDAVRAALSEPGYRAAARKMMKSCEHLRGAALAADLLEQLAIQKSPVLRPAYRCNPWTEGVAA